MRYSEIWQRKVMFKLVIIGLKHILDPDGEQVTLVGLMVQGPQRMGQITKVPFKCAIDLGTRYSKLNLTL